MWKRKEEKEETLLKELCGDDGRLRDFLSSNLCENPLAAISEKDLDVLTDEAEKSGNFRPAVDKAIFEGAENPGERDRYIRVIRDLASKSIHAMEQEREKVEKQGLTDRAASLGARIENQKFMKERAEDIIDIASRFYKEKLLELGESARREARGQVIRTADWQERRTEALEQAGREERRKETRTMHGEAKREAEKQGKREDLAAEERKKAMEEKRMKAEAEEQRIAGVEKAGREAREKERMAN
jgi:hypothetical protein